MDWRRNLTAAHGFLDLGMGQEAWDELDSMPPQDRARVEVVLMRLVILQSMERWEKGAEIARGAVRYYPECPDLFPIGAYAIRRAEDVRTAGKSLAIRRPLPGDSASGQIAARAEVRTRGRHLRGEIAAAASSCTGRSGGFGFSGVY